MTKVLLLHNEVPPYRLPLFNALAEKVDLTVFFSRVRRIDRYWNVDEGTFGFKFEVLKGFARSVRGRDISIRPAVFPKILSTRPDVVVLTLNYETDVTTYVAYLATRLKHIPFVLWMADTDRRYFVPRTSIEGIADGLHSRLKRLLVSRACSVVCYGNLTKKHVIEALGKDDRAVFVGSQVWPIVEQSESRNFEDNPIRFVYVGYLNERKRVRDLIEAFDNIEAGSAELTITGEGPEKENLRRIAGGRNNVRFNDYIEGDAKRNLLNKSHVFLMPSDFDNMPNSILEAMAYGLPIIATHQCNCPEWLQENALVYDAGDVGKLHSYIVTLLKERQRMKEMGTLSLELSRKFDVSFAVNAFMSAITRAVNIRNVGYCR